MFLFKSNVIIILPVFRHNILFLPDGPRFCNLFRLPMR